MASSLRISAGLLILALFINSCASRKQTPAQQQNRLRCGPLLLLQVRPATATIGPAKKEGIKKFSDLIPVKTVVDKGLFNTYKVDGKYYYEIPDSLLGREMLVVTRLTKTPTNTRQYGGEEANDQVWKWEKHDKQIFIRVPSYSVRADSTSDMYKSVKNSTLDVVLAAFDIKAYNKDTTGVVIDVTDFYNGDIAAIGISDDTKKAYKISALDNSRSYIDTIKSFPVNIEARVLKTYRATESPTDNTNAAITFELNTSMLLLPGVAMKARLSDDRVGYFGQSQTDYGTDAQKSAGNIVHTPMETGTKRPRCLRAR